MTSDRSEVRDPDSRAMMAGDAEVAFERREHLDLAWQNCALDLASFSGAQDELGRGSRRERSRLIMAIDGAKLGDSLKAEHGAEPTFASAHNERFRVPSDALGPATRRR